jgi:hypothetical protein
MVMMGERELDAWSRLSSERYLFIKIFSGYNTSGIRKEVNEKNLWAHDWIFPEGKVFSKVDPGDLLIHLKEDPFHRSKTGKQVLVLLERTGELFVWFSLKRKIFP